MTDVEPQASNHETKLALDKLSSLTGDLKAAVSDLVRSQLRHKRTLCATNIFEQIYP